MDPSANLDTLTGLPWANALRQPPAEWTGLEGVQAIHVRVQGLDRLGEIYGDLVAQTAFRHVARRVTRLLCERELCTRLDEDSLLVFTARAADDVGHLVTAIEREVSAAALDVQGQTVPRVAVQVAAGPEAVSAILSRSVESPHTAAAAPALPAAVSRREGRIILRGVTVTLLGDGATVSCTLSSGKADISSTSTGPSTDATRLRLVGDATAGALAQLLPAGHTLAVRTAEVIGRGEDEGVYVTLDLLANDQRTTLLGVASAQDGVYLATARAILNAMNRKFPVLPR